MGKKKSVAVRTLEVGDRVRLTHLESWGDCEITGVHKKGKEVRYSAKVLGTSGHTSVHHLLPEKVRLVETTEDV